MREFFQFIRTESKEFRWQLVAIAVLAGIVNGTLTAVAIGAAKDLRPGVIQVREFLLFAFCITSYWLTKQLVLDRTTTIVEGIVRDVRVRIMRKLRHTPLLVFEKTDRGRIFSTLSSDAIGISMSAGPIINSLSATVIVAFVICYIGVLSLTALFITASIIGAAIFVYLRKSRAVDQNIQDATLRENEFFDNLNGLLSGFKEFKLNRAKSEDFFGTELTQVISSTADLRIQAGTSLNQALLIGQTFLFLTIGGVLFLLPSLVPGDFGVVGPVIAVVLIASGPIGEVVAAIPALAKAKASMANIQRLEADIDSMQSEAEVLAATASVPTPPFESLSCENFSFHYPKNGTRPFTLLPFSFSIKKGETVFIVGGNGSGKSTLLKLVTGLYEPASGERYLNGERVTDGTLGAYRDLFGPIFADFHLFPRILGGQPIDKATVERLLLRMELAGITGLKDGRISNLHLSTGQKKRLAMILAYLDDNPVYVFDEWAADQDPIFRKFFYETLLQELKAKGKAVIAVTHDDRYFHAADRVLKMEYGQLL